MRTRMWVWVVSVVALVASGVGVVGGGRAGAEPRPDPSPAACRVSYEVNGPGTKVWVRCNTRDGAAQPTNVRVHYLWHGSWWDNFDTGHAQTTTFTVTDGSLEWRTGPVDFGSQTPFDGTATRVEVYADGAWQRADVEAFDATVPLVDPGAPTRRFTAPPAPSAAAAAAFPVLCAVSAAPRAGGFDTWTRCAIGDRHVTDARVQYRWHDRWWDDFDTGHAQTTTFTTADGQLEWRTGPVDFGSDSPFEGTATPVEVYVDGGWERAVVAAFTIASPLVDPGVPSINPRLAAELAALQARTAAVARSCPAPPAGTTGVQRHLDVEAGTCTTTGTTEVCDGIQFLCDHGDGVIEGIAVTASTLLAIPLLLAIAAAGSSAAGGLAAAWDGLAGLGFTIPSGASIGAGGALTAGTGLTITAQDIVLAGGALTIANIGHWLYLQASSAGGGDDGKGVEGEEPTSDALEYATRPEKLDHIFDPKHNLEPLVEHLGGREAVVRRMLAELSGLTPATGIFESSVTIGEQTVIVRGAVVDGIVKIGTAFTP